MKILSITTSSTICGVAILEDLNIIKEVNLNNGLTHSESLMPLISQIFTETNLSIENIDLIAVDIGPGSFTGVRIGISTAKAFIDGLNKKSIGISSLEALALNIKKSGIICSLIDARQDNVFCEIFENLENNYIVRRNASFENITNLLVEIKKINPEYSIVFVGDGAIKHKETILSYLPNSNFTDNNIILSSNIGKAAFTAYLSNKETNIEPLYLRKSEAEQKLEEKLNG